MPVAICRYSFDGTCYPFTLDHSVSFGRLFSSFDVISLLLGRAILSKVPVFCVIFLISISNATLKYLTDESSLQGKHRTTTEWKKE